MSANTCNLQINTAEEPVGQNNDKEYRHTQRVSVGLGSGQNNVALSCSPQTGRSCFRISDDHKSKLSETFYMKFYMFKKESGKCRSAKSFQMLCQCKDKNAIRLCVCVCVFVAVIAKRIRSIPC